MLRVLCTTLRRSTLARGGLDASDESGLTLVEMLVSSAISTILLTLMTTMLTVYAKADTSTVNNANAAASVRLTRSSSSMTLSLPTLWGPSQL